MRDHKSQTADSRPRRGFTLVEMLVAVAILTIALGAMGVIFRMSLDAYRASSATAEIMRKLRAITQQIDSDMKGLRRDGIVLFLWGVSEENPYYMSDYPEDSIQEPNTYQAHRYHRDDILLFFANGDFQSYNPQQPKNNGSPKTVRGNLARIQYMIARDRNNHWPDEFGAAGIGGPAQKAERDLRRRTRVLARSQHIVTADPDFADRVAAVPVAFPDFEAIAQLGAYDQALYQSRNCTLEYDTDGLLGWVNAPREDMSPWPLYGLYAMLSTCTGVGIYNSIYNNGMYDGGLRVDPDAPDANAIHLTFAQGVRDFTVQVWAGNMWYPRTGYINPVTGNIADTDFYTTNVGGYDVIDTQRLVGEYYDLSEPLQYRFLKFSFRLYDSRGFFRDGLVFTHIVDLGDDR